uniref:Uncharacterized protein n=1 Tax=Helicoverpa zea single nucleopolyhedrovirus TaxID=10468 RepID=A0A0H4AQR4_9ABAC|nr:hypothetical protein [Helicoverpa zea single nucleopolyhedrovirus]
MMSFVFLGHDKKSRPVSNEKIRDQFKHSREFLLWSMISFVFLGHESKQKITARFERKDPRLV